MEKINWLKGMTLGISENKSVICIEFNTTTGNPIKDEVDSVQSIYIPSTEYVSVLRALISTGKQIEKDFGLDLKLKELGDDINV